MTVGVIYIVAAGTLFGAWWATRDRERSLLRMQLPLTERAGDPS